ncbi:MAG TPA: hypothetical protein VGD75_11150, partial [Bradyrhizobium sp.]
MQLATTKKPGNAGLSLHARFRSGLLDQDLKSVFGGKHPVQAVVQADRRHVDVLLDALGAVERSSRRNEVQAAAPHEKM